MIEFKSGNMFARTPQGGYDVYVNTVNCVGVMGKGVAKEFLMHPPNHYVLNASVWRGPRHHS